MERLNENNELESFRSKLAELFKDMNEEEFKQAIYDLEETAKASSEEDYDFLIKVLEKVKEEL